MSLSDQPKAHEEWAVFVRVRVDGYSGGTVPSIACAQLGPFATEGLARAVSTKLNGTTTAVLAVYRLR